VEATVINEEPMHYFLSFLILVGLILTFTLPAAATGNFHLDTMVLGQVRNDENSQREIPTSGFLGMAMDLPQSHLVMETDMRVFRDVEKKLDDYDLYQAVLHWHPLEALKIDFGRQFLNQGFTAEMVDALTVTFMPLPILDIAFYSGIPRSVEIGDFNKNDGLLSGLTIGLKKTPHTSAKFYTTWRKLSVSTMDLTQNDLIHVGANFSHEVATGIASTYVILEYDVTGKVLDTGIGGIDIYPAQRIALNFEGSYSKVNRTRNQPTILSLLAHDQLLIWRVATTWTLIPKFLDVTQSYSYQRIELQNNVLRHGHLADLALPLSLEAIHLSIEPGYYFARSFGGTLHGGRALLHEQWTDEFYTEVVVDFTKYTKVTSNNDIAFSSVAWAGYEILKGWTLSGGAEYNKNNEFNKDIRGSFKIEYTFDHKI
jgi:hypothetical protein